MAELRDSSIWAATCDLKAQVLRNDPRPLAVRASAAWSVLVAAGVVALALGHTVPGVVLVGLGAVPLVLLLLVLTRSAGHLMLEADGFTYRTLAGRTVNGDWDRCEQFRAVPRSLRTGGHVEWTGPDGAPGGTFLPGAGGLPPQDLAVLLNRYHDRFAHRAR